MMRSVSSILYCCRRWLWKHVAVSECYWAGYSSALQPGDTVLTTLATRPELLLLVYSCSFGVDDIDVARY